jgi:hypothetical protein
MPTQTFHVTADQKEVLVKEALAVGVSVGAWIKGALFSQGEVPRETDGHGTWLTMASGDNQTPGSLSALRTFVGELNERVTALEEDSREEGVQPVEGGDNGMVDMFPSTNKTCR